jgi:centromere/kinetochore protein ZW10
MMPPMSRYILDDWLYTAVPASLDDMVDYQKTLALVHDFACKLDLLRWPGSEAFHDWVSSAPRIWLNKCRETALDWTRNQISLGIGNPIVAERVEKQMVARQEVEDLVAATAGNEVSLHSVLMVELGKRFRLSPGQFILTPIALNPMLPRYYH